MTVLELNDLASRTMQAVCSVRVSYSHIVGRDPIAEKIIKHLPDADRYRQELDAASRGMFSRSVIMRTCFFQDVVSRYGSDVDQLVILSSGLDFKFLKDSCCAKKPVFLVDRPESIEVMDSAFSLLDIDLGFIKKIAFNIENIDHHSLIECLNDSGFSREKKTLFLWEGATFYIHTESVTAVLVSLLQGCDNVILAADFINKDSGLAKSQQKSSLVNQRVNETFDVLARYKEPWHGYFSHVDLLRMFAELGAVVLENDWDSDLERRYLTGDLMANQSMFYLVVKKFSGN